MYRYSDMQRRQQSKRFNHLKNQCRETESKMKELCNKIGKKITDCAYGSKVRKYLYGIISKVQK